MLIDYAGRAIRLTDERLRHVLEHPEMAGMEPLIGSALATPDLVVQSASDPDVALYYLPARATVLGNMRICVVVKYEAGGGFVLTAYLTDKPKKGSQLWPKK